MFLNSSAEKSNHLVEQAALSADQAIKSTQQVANETLDNLTNTMQDLCHKATPAMERAVESVNAFAHRGVDGVRETSQQLRIKAEKASENTVNYIRQEPVKAVLIAAATGAALMALINLVNHARHRS